jgi:hypothetical protein
MFFPGSAPARPERHAIDRVPIFFSQNQVNDPDCLQKQTHGQAFVRPT